MTASAAASNNRKVVSAGIIAERAVVCTCNARNDENVFSNIEVAGLELAGKSIANAEFHYSKVTDAVFENCDINYGEFKFAVLENVTFVNAVISTFLLLTMSSLSTAFLTAANSTLPPVKLCLKTALSTVRNSTPIRWISPCSTVLLKEPNSTAAANLPFTLRTAIFPVQR